MTLLILVSAVVIASLVSVLGGIALIYYRRHSVRLLQLMVPFGAGALLAAAFFDLLPEALEMSEEVEPVLLWVLVGFLVFFVFERTAHWFHHHHEHDNRQSNRVMIVIGDALHNIIDGLAIGAAFLVSVPTGIITTLAVAAHEIPKELGTFSMLLKKGWRGRRVVGVNLLTAVGTLLAAVGLFMFGELSEGVHSTLLAVTAGLFIYIAASDIIPDIHEQPKKLGTIQALMLIAGVVIVGLLVGMLHSH